MPLMINIPTVNYIAEYWRSCKELLEAPTHGYFEFNPEAQAWLMGNVGYSTKPLVDRLIGKRCN